MDETKPTYNGSQAFEVYPHEATERNPKEIADASETSKGPVDHEIPQR